MIAGAATGAGAAKRLSAVRWGVAGDIVIAWVLTLPAAALFAAMTYGISQLFGSGAGGPVVITLALLIAVSAVFARRFQQAAPAPQPAMTSTDA